MEGLFIDSGVFKGLLPLETPAVLRLKPSELYSKIRKVAQIRYGYDLPEKQTDIKSLQHPTSKLALLRDICLKLGVKILAANKDLSLDNEQPVPAPAQPKKRQQPQRPVTVEEATYANLPFSANDFAELFPVVKHLEL